VDSDSTPLVVHPQTEAGRISPDMLAYRLESEIVLAALAEITVRRAFENFAA
jgi:hypothetical protein